MEKIRAKRAPLAAFATSGTQPSQANLQTPSRVRNAQTLKDERAYVKAQESGAPTNEVYQLRRKALPSMPCMDCGKRMQCIFCDKQTLLKELVEDYANPPATYEKEIQADVLADLAAESAGDEDAGPTAEEVLALKLRESEQRADFLRRRIKTKSAEMDDLQRKYDYQTDELRERTEQRDDFEAKWIQECETRRQAEQHVKQLQCDMAAALVECESKLAAKQEEIEALHAQRHKQHDRMQTWLGRWTARADRQSVLQEWWWKLQQGHLAREGAASLRSKEEEMLAAKQCFEKQIEQLQAQYAALERTSQQKQQALETVVTKYELDIRELRTELGDVQSTHERLQRTYAADEARWKQERTRLDAATKGREAELRREKELRTKELRERESVDMARAQQEEEKVQHELEIEEEFGLPDIEGGGGKGSTVRLQKLEESLRSAEKEANVIAGYLEMSQQKVLFLRRRLQAEVKCHLDSKAKFHVMSRQKLDLETKLCAQERCMKRQRIPKAEVKCRALGLKNHKLSDRIDNLCGRLAAVKTLANHSSQKDVRLAIMQAAGKEDIQARRAKLFERLALDFDLD